MGTLSEELEKAGLVSKKQANLQKLLAIKAEQQQARRVQNSRNRFGSVKEFVEDVGRRLKANPDGTREIFRDLHWVADDLALNRKKRSRLHAWLCRITEQIAGMDPQERATYLDKEVRNY